MADQGSGRSKRQRLYELMKTTKDVYIPTISNTITQLASEATTKALNYADGDSQRETDINYDVKGAQILLYPHFTRHSEHDERYYTQVHGWVYSTEGSNRKKRIILSLARQLTKSNNNAVSDMTAGQLDEQLNNMQNVDDDASSVYSGSSAPSVNTRSLRRTGTASSAQSEATTSSSIQSETDEVLKERIANFVNKSLGNTELIIAVGGANREEIKTVELLTDANGNFNIDVDTSFKPTYVQVAIANDEKIFVLHDTIFPGDSQYGVISDIDDTIKHTGVLSDKRTVFRNVFSDNMETWEIPGAADTYRFLSQKFNVSFFYVSNSPYQLYSNLVKFFEMFEFPKGSMYLKKYSGNILNTFFEASHTRKKAPLERVIEHFPDKKFFLIGDSGEQDLEAYTDFARAHPGKVAGIYIRLAENSMSTETYKMLVDMLNKRSEPVVETPDDVQQKFEQLKTSEENLIDLEDEPTPGISKEKMSQLVHESKVKSEMNDLEKGATEGFFANSDQLVEKTSSGGPRVKSPPPAVPSKPRALQSTAVPKSPRPSTSSTIDSSLEESPVSPPTLPRRPVPVLPPRTEVHRTRKEPAPTFNSNSFADDETEEWITRILTSLLILRKAGDASLKLFIDYSEVQEDIVKYLKAKQHANGSK
ncbi:CYFA0S25e00628g1_1 [Cyberlindnera fabianii]|uniref:CYFA0S25e00628g1_1 n=1 Tax=Cyberlindnera fabianii TaxID=36022 RepID=A0A061BFK5_CYBFA|nr:Phosphatidate phosphatase APP1 [Cyberlindnera fabianii]CDR46667.1 CYFA0S25e00628g1_1 [Cyberlindnera fabianii]